MVHGVALARVPDPVVAVRVRSYSPGGAQAPLASLPFHAALMPVVVVAEPLTVARVSVRQGLFTCSDQVRLVLGLAVTVGPAEP